MPTIRSTKWGSYSSWVNSRLGFDTTIISQVRILWKDYLAYCKEYGFEPVELDYFMTWIADEEGVKLECYNKGRVRRFAHGVHLRSA